MLSFGVPDRRLAVLPTQYALLLEDTSALSVGQPDGLTSEEHAALQKKAQQVTELCERLAAFGIPETLQHNDLHDGNVFVGEGERYTLADWGDACLSHPFSTLVVTLNSGLHRLGRKADDPERNTLIDAYLEAWEDRGKPAELREALSLVFRLDPIMRALNWYRALSRLEPAQSGEYASAVPEWLRTFLTAE